MRQHCVEESTAERIAEDWALPKMQRASKLRSREKPQGLTEIWRNPLTLELWIFLFTWAPQTDLRSEVIIDLHIVTVCFPFACISRFSNIEGLRALKGSEISAEHRLRRENADLAALCADGKVSVSKTHRCLWQFYRGWDLLGLCFVLLKPGLRLQVFWKSQVAK